jgi:hypothetical protein
MRWVHLEEAYDWMRWDGPEPYPGAFKRDQYKQVPDELAQRLQEAWNNLREVSQEVDRVEKPKEEK